MKSIPFIIFVFSIILTGCGDTDWKKDLSPPHNWKKEDSIQKALDKRNADSISKSKKLAKEANFLKALHEPDMRKVKHEMYRLYWDFAFDPNRPIENLITIESNDSGKYFITTKWYIAIYPNRHCYIINNMRICNDTLLREFRRELMPDAWFDLKSLLDGGYFWSRPTKDGVEGTDGWSLSIEGTAFNKDSNKWIYHEVIRWCPESEPLIAFYKKMRELTGVFFINKDRKWEERKPEEYRSYAY